MAVELATAYVSLVPSTSGIAAQIRKELGGPLESESKTSGKRASAGFGSTFMSGLGTVVSRAGQAIVRGIESAGVVAGGVLASALWGGWSRVTTIEDATSALTISLGDAAAAGKVLDDVLDVVTGTPYNLDQFAAAAQQLVGFGVETSKVPGYLTAIGEASATQGKRANEFADRLATVFGQISASGQVSLADVWRISDAGVNALAILANSFGVTRDEMKDMISSGAVPAGEALDALAQGILEGTDGPAGATRALAGTMAGLRETLSGAAGGFRASVSRLGAAIIEPLSGALTVGFTGLAGLFDQVGGRIKATFQGLADSPGFQRFTEWLSTLPGLIGPALDRLSGLGPALAPLGAAIAAIGAGGLSSALGPLGALVPTISPLLAAIGGLVAASPELRAAFGDIAKVVGGALSAAFETVAPALALMADLLVPALASVMESLGPIIGDVAALLASGLAAAIEAIAPALPAIGSAISSIATVLSKALSGALGAVIPMLAQLAETIAYALAIGLEKLIPPLTMVIDRIGGALTRALAAVLPPVVAIVQALASAFIPLLEALIPIVLQVVDVALALIEALLPLLPTLLELVADLLPPLLELLIAVAEPVIALAGFVLDLLTPALEVLIGVIGTFIGWLASLGDATRTVAGVLSTVWNGIKNTILGVWNGIKTGVSAAVNWVKDTISAVMSKISNTWFRAWDNMRTVFRNIWDGIRRALKAPINWIIDMINWLIRGMNRISISIPDWMPGIGGKSFGVNIAEIPHLAEGGIVTRPTLALIGEAGPEAVVPLDGRHGLDGPIVLTLDLGEGIRQRYRIERTREGRTAAIALGAA